MTGLTSDATDCRRVKRLNRSERRPILTWCSGWRSNFLSCINAQRSAFRAPHFEIRIMTLRAPLEHCRINRAIRPPAGPSQHVLKSRLLHPLSRQSVRIASGLGEPGPRIIRSPPITVCSAAAEPVDVFGSLGTARPISRTAPAMAAHGRARVHSHHVLRQRPSQTIWFDRSAQRHRDHHPAAGHETRYRTVIQHVWHSPIVYWSYSLAVHHNRRAAKCLADRDNWTGRIRSELRPHIPSAIDAAPAKLTQRSIAQTLEPEIE
jgi:hypothetical protein